MDLTISSYYKYTDAGEVGTAGVAEVLFNCCNLTVHDIRVVKTKSGSVFYALPQRALKQDDGTNKYKNICGIYSKEKYSEFQSAMSSAFKDYFDKQPAVKECQPLPPLPPVEDPPF